MTTKPAPKPEPEDDGIYFTGDVNGDGKITAGDALLILKYLSGKEWLSKRALEAAKILGNDEVSAADALEILKFLAGSESVLN